jgi:hypothetical protein
MATYSEVMQALRAADAAGNTADAQRLARIAQSLSTQQQAAPAQSQEPVGVLEQMFGAGSPIARVAKGAIVDPVLGFNQLVGETGILGERVKQEARGNVRQVEQAVQEGRRRIGSEGFDPYQLAGAVVSPINRLTPTATAPTALGRVGQGAATGALFGGLQPVTNVDNYIEEKMQQIGIGAAFGGLLSGGIESASKVSKVLKDVFQPVTQEGRTKALREYISKLTGDKKDEIVQALRQSDELVTGARPTAAEAVADIPEATALAAYQQNLATSPARGISARFAGREAEQEAARVAALRSVGGDEASLLAAQAQRTAATAPLREEALTQSNIAGQMIPRLEDEIASRFASKGRALQVGGRLETEASQQQQLARNFFPVSGFPRVSPELSQNFDRVLGNIEGAVTSKNIAAQRQAEASFKKLQLDSIAQSGFYPLRTAPIIDKIDSVLTTPGIRASDLAQQTLSAVRQKLAGLSDTRGVIDSRDLYTVRKEIGNTIKTLSRETGNFDDKLVARLDTNLKSYIDNAIESAGGTDWKRYLQTYEQASKKINQMEIGQALEQKLQTSLGDKQRAGVFATAVENAAQTIKRSTGQARFKKLDEVLEPKQIATVNRVLADVQRKAKAEALATKSRVVGAETAELPNLLNRAALLTNTVLKAVKKDATEEINKMAAEMMLDPRKLAAFIEGVPAKQAETVVTAFMSRLSDDVREAFRQTVNTQGLIRGGTEAITAPEEM